MICVPIGGGTMARAFREIEKCARLADVLELRMDLIGDGDLTLLVGRIRSRSKAVKILVTPRIGNGGPLNESRTHADRSIDNILAEAVDLGVDYVAVDIRDTGIRWDKLRALREECGGGTKTKLIASYHDFRETPPPRTLRRIFDECVGAEADIAKIVTWARRPEDNLKVLGIIPYARKRGREIIAFCMGPLGRASRIAAPLLGSAMSFAALRRGSESAPGQLTVREMRQILGVLGHGG